MSEKFYTILTNVGKGKIANAISAGQKVNLTKMKMGDSNGAYYTPSETQTDLVHKVYECNTTSVEIDKKNPNWITITSAIPSDVGGFSIREVGIFDDTNNLIAIGKYPETYKPVANDGSTKELYIKMTLEVTNASSVELKIDPTVILATKKDVNNLDTKIEENNIKLKDKANKNDVRVSTSIRPINVAEMDTETKKLFTGGAVGVVGERSVGNENIKDDSINEYKLSFVSLGKNKFVGDFKQQYILKNNEDDKNVIFKIDGEEENKGGCCVYVMKM